MQISTVNNTFSIKIFAWKIYLVCKFTSSEEKSPSQAVFNSMVWHSGISGSKCPCSVAQFTHPRLCHCNYHLGHSVNSEPTWSIQTASTVISHISQVEHWEPLSKPASAAQVLLLPAASPFSPCNTLCCSATPWPRLAGGCKLVFSQFPTLIPKWLCWQCKGEHKDEILGHCSPATKNETPDRNHWQSWESISR